MDRVITQQKKYSYPFARPVQPPLEGRPTETKILAVFG